MRACIHSHCVCGSIRACALQVAFQASEALAELERLGLVLRVPAPPPQEPPSSLLGSQATRGPHGTSTVASPSHALTGEPAQDAAGGGTSPEACWWAAVPLEAAVPVIEAHWAGLLWRRVQRVLQAQAVMPLQRAGQQGDSLGSMDDTVGQL